MSLSASPMPGAPAPRPAWLPRLGLALLPVVLALAVYYTPLFRGDCSRLEAVGDGRFYAYQLAHACDLGGQWWRLGTDELVGAPYPTGAAKHPGLYEGVDLLLVGSLTGLVAEPALNSHLMGLLVLAFNGWVAAGLTRRLTGSWLWAVLATVLITVNVSTAYRFNMSLHLFKYGWVLLAVWAFWNYLETPALGRSCWLGLVAALVLQGSFYIGYFLALVLGVWWLGLLVAGRLGRPHFTGAAAAGIAFALAGAALTFPAWLIARQQFLSDQSYFHRNRGETWTYASELWQYFLSPTWKYTESFLAARGAGHWTFLEQWHYPGLVVLLALAVLLVLRLRGQTVAVPQPGFLRMLLGLSALLVCLSLAGGPGAALFDLVPSFRCYGRAGLVAVALLSVAAPLIGHGLLGRLRTKGARAVLVSAALVLSLWEAVALSRWIEVPSIEPHAPWVEWLAHQPADVRMAAFPDYPEGTPPSWVDEWHWDGLYQSLRHRHAALNGCEFALLEADLKQLGTSYQKLDAEGLRFVVSLGYDTLAFQQNYLDAHPWITGLPWLERLGKRRDWHLFRATAAAPRFPVVTVRDLLASLKMPEKPARVPPGACITDELPLLSPLVVKEAGGVLLRWENAGGRFVGKPSAGLFQHLFAPHRPAFRVQAPMQPGCYRLVFLDAAGQRLAARRYEVDSALSTGRQALAKRSLTVRPVCLNVTEGASDVRVRIENKTPYYLETHLTDQSRPRGLPRFYPGLAEPWLGSLMLTAGPLPARGQPARMPLLVPLPRDLPPGGCVDVVIPLAQLPPSCRDGVRVAPLMVGVEELARGALEADLSVRGVPD